ncbi:MAG: phosphotransferase family protein, partial [Steroidobacteraceae bacterium]|nr:phosphotransferase family protein [Steroidobacteraceae bacterium]
MDIDLAALDRYLTVHLPDYAGPLSAERFAGGQSNPTYRLTTPRRQYVLRRKPAGPLLASAHAIDREFRVQQALGAGHTGVPVAKMLVLCMDESVIGTAFYVMEHVDGRIFWDTSFPEIEHARRWEYFEAMNAALAALHRVDPVVVGLADFGKPSGYVARQLRRWGQQYRDDTAAGRIADMDRLLEWLLEHLPLDDDEAAIVHGDYRCDNLIFHSTEPRVLAILDWELATLGHPVADFAYHLMMYRLPTLAFPGLLGLDLATRNIPTEAQYVATYCRHTGRESIPHLDFYVAYNLFRLAAILHGIRG